MSLNNMKKFGIYIGFREIFQDSEGLPVLFDHISFAGTSINEEGLLKIFEQFTEQIKPLIKDFFNDLKKNGG